MEICALWQFWMVTCSGRCLLRELERMWFWAKSRWMSAFMLLIFCISMGSLLFRNSSKCAGRYNILHFAEKVTHPIFDTDDLKYRNIIRAKVVHNQISVKYKYTKKNEKFLNLHCRLLSVDVWTKTSFWLIYLPYFMQHLYESFNEEPGYFQFATAITSNDIEEIQTFLDAAVNARFELY